MSDSAEIAPRTDHYIQRMNAPGAMRPCGQWFREFSPPLQFAVFLISLIWLFAS